jgi:hypothetical protein
MDDFSLVQTIDRLGEGIVVRVPDTADGRLKACFSKPLGVLYGQILAAAIRVMDQAASGDWPSGMTGLLEIIQDKACMCGAADPPANHTAREAINDEG